MSTRANVLLLTCIASPYQVELCNAIAAATQITLSVVYVYPEDRNRNWKQLPLTHKHIIWGNDTGQLKTLQQRLASFDLVIFNYYQHPWLIQLMQDCINQHIPWCFWGERPGYRSMAWIGTLYRRWKLAALHRQQVPIWGIGAWAIEGYRQEFGHRRQYFNFPYFSDLARFRSCHTSQQITDAKPRRFLYSGSLIQRKGVDLLATAFQQVAKNFSDIQLDIVGDGPLRNELMQQLAPYKKQVKFHGFQHWDTLPKFYQAADILCVPSRYDGWALVVPEGLAAGLPVISTDRTGAALELIVPGSNGWLVPAGDAAALYGAMQAAALLSNMELEIYSQNAQASVAKHTLLDGVQKFHEYVHETVQAIAQS